MSFALLRHDPPHPWVSVPEDNDNDAMNTIFLSQLLLNSLIIMSTTTAAAKQLAYASSHGASSTSIYTTEEKQDSYQTLPQVLEAKCADPLVRQVIQDLMKVCADITDALRVALVTVEGSTNDFGDSQLSVDVSVGFLRVGASAYRLEDLSFLSNTCFTFRLFPIKFCGKHAESHP